MRFRTRASAAAFFAFALISTGHAQTLAPVQTSTQATAVPPDDEFNALREPAAAGDAQAQFALADHYFRGVGVAQDYGQALVWFRKSAAQDYAPALNQLGYMHQHKFGLPRDYKRAVDYYRLAANKGYALGEYNLAAMFKAGLWVKRDYKQAFDWYRMAADQNLSEAEEGSRVLLPVGVGRQARLCSGSGMVSPRCRARRLRRRKPAWLHGRARMGPAAELRRGILLVLQIRGPWQRRGHGKHRL